MTVLNPKFFFLSLFFWLTNCCCWYFLCFFFYRWCNLFSRKLKSRNMDSVDEARFNVQDYVNEQTATKGPTCPPCNLWVNYMNWSSAMTAAAMAASFLITANNHITILAHKHQRDDNVFFLFFWKFSTETWKSISFCGGRFQHWFIVRVYLRYIFMYNVYIYVSNTRQIKILRALNIHQLNSNYEKNIIIYMKWKEKVF